jgi:hypothetical protein
MKIKSSFLAAHVFFIWGAISLSNASAASLDFSGPLAAGSSLAFSLDDLTVTATAFSADRNSYVNQSAFGLGVSSWLLDNPQIDGLGPDDLLLLTCSKEVTLLSAGFSWVGANDQFRLLVDGTPVLDADIPTSRTFDFTSALSASLLTGTAFGFTVTQFNDDYFLRSIDLDSSPVPIPGSVVLLSSGLLGLIAIRRSYRN